LHVLHWHGKPLLYIAEALGIGYAVSIDLVSATRLANVLLGTTDIQGVRGRHGINLRLASVLTEWRIRLRDIARSPV
jgi:transcription antitermination factor NusA-like protein